MKSTENLPMPVDKLEALAAHYDAHDTSSEMEDGEWVDPRPMKTTSLRLPSEVVDELKSRAQQRGVRYTTLVRQIIEAALSGSGTSGSQLVQINERLARIEAAVVGKPAPRTKPARAASKSRRAATTTGKTRTAPKSSRTVHKAS